ncbi:MULTISPECIES: DNA polymerase III subunit epsilon [Halocynthiibacter]|uniref:DNA polymerase III subunit epsilon n=1 Tax=Halocynthiibacter halioticoli TaxID=2986804 RepID=A0AAE3J4A2_9RHOB|nr:MULTISPECIES: DNA polymerase III subunit epsilon [Halocynthiibacter]MCV6825617.1 DNA polymerase III subunit epsilon [Halocynthiibacter halioticoli]MCW4058618.1 DNA polymerase III subunit epsilon [Halocynthiibacter sp. SDUM655004]MDE0591008.1 DNA polymerase III subunit epsilon [Halocynthiibacter sp. C4]
MRELVMDTETTGFKPEEGDRLVEIGAVELWNHVPTGKTYHQYINPMRDMPEDAFKVHGLSEEFLSDKPVFKDVAQDFLDFIGNDRLVIHNAAFDMKFLNAELGWLNRPPLPMSQALDTLAIARKKFPGSPASLDALCRRFGIDNSNRVLHGALLDSEILAEVYLELIGGRQPDFALKADQNQKVDVSSGEEWRPQRRQNPLPSRLTEEEAAAHAKFIAELGDGAIWNKA